MGRCPTGTNGGAAVRGEERTRTAVATACGLQIEMTHGRRAKRERARTQGVWVDMVCVCVAVAHRHTRWLCGFLGVSRAVCRVASRRYRRCIGCERVREREYLGDPGTVYF